MKIMRKDELSIALMVLGAVVVFARLQSYSWWLIGSWKGAVGVLAVIGLVIALTNIVSMIRVDDVISLLEMALWLIAATVVIGSVFTPTTMGDFIGVTVMISLACAAQVWRDMWLTAHNNYKSKSLMMPTAKG